MDTTRKRRTNKNDATDDKTPACGGKESSTSSILKTFFFTGFIFFIVEKCVTAEWDLFSIPQFPLQIKSYFNIEMTVYLVGWFAAQCLIYMLPFGGELVEGLPVKETGNKLQYRLNAFFALCVNIIGFFTAVLIGWNVTSVSDRLFQLTTSSVLMIFVFSVIVFVKANRHQRNLTGNSCNNWFNGTELNPRWGLFDLKYVCFRSGIIGWILMNFVNIAKSFETGGPTLTLLVVAAFQLLYVADYFWFEDGLLFTRDIVHECLGYNLLAQFLMIPFCFSVQTRYLMTTKYSSPLYFLIPIAILNGIGYWIYRGSNSEKNNFRKNPHDPSFAGYEVIPTDTGKHLLVSGWWGWSRHPNYLGDIIISFSYAFATGFNHLLPYFNPFVLLMMLVDRERKDGAECKKRYEDAWVDYCYRVPYRIVPFLY